MRSGGIDRRSSPARATSRRAPRYIAMYDSLERIRDDDAARGLAVRFCREVYIGTRSSMHKWHAVSSMEMRLNASREDTQAALKFAIRKGWLDAFGDPIFAVILLEPGRVMFANADVALPKARVRSR